MANPLTQGRADFASSGLLFWGRVGVVVLPAVVGLAVILATPRLPQSQAYHQLADRRVLFGVPHFGDVLTSAGFLVVGVLGLSYLAKVRRDRQCRAFAHPQETWPYAVFFAGVTATAFGSAWYHLSPTNDTLLWDRVPMAVAFTALFGAVLAERVDRRAAIRLLPVLLAVGVLSVFHWHRTERLGAGDVRLYLLVQVYALVAVALMLLLFPARYTHSGYLWGALGWYVAAKGFEALDKPVYALTRVVSGHNLKHILAAVAVLWVLRMLQRRGPAPLPPLEHAAFPRGGPQPGERRY